MNRICFSIFAISVLLVCCASQGFTQEVQQEEISILAKNPKLIRSDDILDDFRNGKSTARVIVDLVKDPEFENTLTTIEEMGLRKELENAIRAKQNAAISSIDPDELRIRHRFKTVYCFSAEVTLEGLKQLTEANEVEAIYEDGVLEYHLAQGIDLINAYDIPSEYSGQGVAIAIIDSGIDYYHEKLGNDDFPNSKVIGGDDIIGRQVYPYTDHDPLDGYGHGTCCAGIAAGDPGNTVDYIGGVAYNAKLYALKIADDDGNPGIESDLGAALEWCYYNWNANPAYPIKIISISLGYRKKYGSSYVGYSSECDDALPSYTQVASNCKSVGITIFASSGNHGYCDSMTWPACMSTVNSVGQVYDANNLNPDPWCGVSIDSCVKDEGPVCPPQHSCTDILPDAKEVVCSSNTASFLDFLAPGYSAYTTYIGGGYKENFAGTSSACPYVAGAAACLQSAANIILERFLTPEEVKAILANTGEPLTDPKLERLVPPQYYTTPLIDLKYALYDLYDCAIDDLILDEPITKPLTIGAKKSIKLKPGFHVNGSQVAFNAYICSE